MGRGGAVKSEERVWEESLRRAEMVLRGKDNSYAEKTDAQDLGWRWGLY